MAADYTHDEGEYHNLSSLKVRILLLCFESATNEGQDALLAPFLALVSKSALRIYLNTLLLIGVSLLLFGVSGIAYGIFYLRFIPAVGLERVVHLQFG